MSEAVEEYAKEYALKQHVKIVKNLMESTGFSLEKALDILGIQGEKRELVIRQLQQEYPTKPQTGWLQRATRLFVFSYIPYGHCLWSE